METNSIKTAEEFLKSQGCNYRVGKEKLYFSDVTKEDMIEFAKMHVAAFRREINNKTELWDDCAVIPRVSIDEIYLITNIK